MRRFLALALLLAFALPASAQEIVGSTRVPAGLNYTFVASAVQIGSGTGDKGTITIPSYITKFRNNGVQIFNCSGTPGGSPLVNMWTGASATGTQVGAFSSANITANTTTSTLTGGTASGSALAISGATTIYINVATAASAPVTCSFGFGATADLTGG